MNLAQLLIPVVSGLVAFLGFDAIGFDGYSSFTSVG
jgi:hypothetical protein